MELTTIGRLVAEDPLSTFVKWYFETRPLPRIPRDGFTEFDGISGVVLFREGPMQVQYFLCHAEVEIPDHQHPNVDSYEVGSSGIEFRHSGRLAVSFRMDSAGKPAARFGCIRVRPGDAHGGRSSPQGGSFFSVQHWLHGIPPSSVHHDWDGESIGTDHAAQRRTGGVVCLT